MTKQNIMPGVSVQSGAHMNSTFNIYGMMSHGPGSNPPSSMIGEIHILEIVNHAEDVGQDGYMEELDWSIEHHSNCERSMHTAEEIRRLKYPIVPQNTLPSRVESYLDMIVFNCPIAQEIQAHGLDRLAICWTDLEPGTYKIALEQANSNDLYTTSASGYPGYSLPEPARRIVLL